MKRYSIILLTHILCLCFATAQKVEVGSDSNPSKLVITGLSDSTALSWDNGNGSLQNASDAILWNRAKFRLLLDADNNTVASSQFSLFSGVDVGNNDDAPVNFNLDGGKSWINSGNFGIGTTNPTSDLEILGPNDSKAIEWDSGGISLRHHFDMLVSNRGWMRFLIDADNDDDNAHFALYSNKSSSSGTPEVRFGLDGNNSWIGPGNFGLGVINPSEKLEVSGAMKIGFATNAIPEGGTIRYDGSKNDFEGYNGFNWKSLTTTIKITDGDSDTRVEVDDGADSDQVEFFLKNILSSRLSRNAVARTILSFPNNSDNIIIGSTGVNSIQTGSDNIFMGPSVGLSLQNSHENILIGKNNAALSTNTDSCVYIGNNIGVTNVTGQNNVAIGHKATFGGTNFQRSVVLGANAGEGLNRSDAVIIGYKAAEMDFSDTSNAYQSVMIGAYAGQGNEGSKNTLIGWGANADIIFVNGSGNQNVAVGHNAVADNSFAVAIGANSFAGDFPGYNNSVAVGFEARADGDATSIGTQADASIGGIALGYLADAGLSDAVIGNTSVDDIGGYSGWTNLSDGRVKFDVSEEVAGLHFINSLRPVNYNIDYGHVSKMIGEEDKLTEKQKNTPGHQRFRAARDQKSLLRQSGFIAQEVETLVQDLGIDFNGVSKPAGDDILYGLRYSEFIPHIVKAVQEQQAMLEEKDRKILSLEEQLLMLSDRIAALEKQ